MEQEQDGSLSTFSSISHELRRNWGWLLALGILLLILGIIAIVDSVSFTVISMFLFGWVLLVAGIIEAVQAFRHRRGGHLFLHALNAALSIIVGLMLIRHPLAGALVVTLLLAAYFTVAGIFRIVYALSFRVKAWGWALADGVITFILGIFVWLQWPVSGLWIIGLFIGIDLIVAGWSEVMLAVAARRTSL
ncbi:MAG: HdeD family acid-resistance protein [Acidobacteriota bacterium]|nr:HdeD family acid-resistance protein [Acidobacteriota bacterium]